MFTQMNIKESLQKLKVAQLELLKQNLINQARRYRKLLVIKLATSILIKQSNKAYTLRKEELDDVNHLFINISDYVTIKLIIKKDNPLNDLDDNKILAMLFLLLNKDYKLFTKAYEEHHIELIEKIIILDKIKENGLIKFMYNYPKNIINKQVNTAINSRYIKTLKTRFDLDVKELAFDIENRLELDCTIELSYILTNKE